MAIRSRQAVVKRPPPRPPNATAFARRMRAVLDRGGGFVPLVGSGLSVASGIPIGKDLGEYLGHCLSEAVVGRWNPAAANWPNLSEAHDSSNLAIAGGLMPKPKNEEKKKERKYTGTAVGDDGTLKWLKWEAAGALANWRTTLQFLSRLRYTKAQRPELGSPDERLVDSFFFHMTRGHRPNVGHLMLAHLADALRIRTLLTTNFDTLLEAAFAQLGMPLTTFDVHQKAGLPDADLVLAQQSVVKLHGGRYGLRADFTLDEWPSEPDRQTFVKYFAPGDLGREKLDTRNHLLVLGVSGSDGRMISLIQHAMKSLSPGEPRSGLHVFWVCYNEDEIAAVRRRLTAGGPAGCGSRIHFTVQQDLGLFLLELYQRLLWSLPPAGADFPAFWSIAPAPYRPTNQNVFDTQRDKIQETIDSSLKDSRPEIVVVNGGRGISSVASAVFDRVCRIHNCVWLELEDFTDCQELQVTLLDTLARNLGTATGPAPNSEASTPQGWGKALGRFASHSHRKLVIFLNSRDGPGLNAGLYPRPWHEGRQARTFWSLLRKSRQKNVLFVVLVGKQGFAVPPRRTALGKECRFVRNLRKQTVNFTQKGIVREVLRWLGGLRGPQAKDARRYVYAMTLFRHSRQPAANYSWALIKAPRQLRTDGKDNDRIRADWAARWLKKLTLCHAVREKPGGYAWMHTDVRDVLRKRIEKKYKRDGIANLRAECHQGIADFYVKLFRASNDPRAALESLYHRHRCIEFANDLNEACGSEAHLRRTALREAIVTLQLARARLMSCGYFANSSNLVAQLAENAFREPIGPLEHELQRTCEEVLKDFAREAGDVPRAHEYAGRLERMADPGGTFGSSAADLRELRRSYERGVLLTGMRRYRGADGEFRGVFLKLELNRDGQHKQPWAVPGVITLRQQGRQWTETIHFDQAKLRLAIESLRRYMFLHMLDIDANHLSGQRIRSNTRSAYDERLYILATELMRHVEDHEFLQRENAYIRTQYANVLCSLRRYHESHRRLNEATGYLACLPPAAAAVPLAIVDMRRAQTYLHQMRELGDRRFKQEPLKKKAVAYLDDAYFALQRAEQRFHATQRAVVWWRTWLRELQLAVCAEIVRLGNRPPGRAREGGKCSTVCDQLSCCRFCRKDRARVVMDNGIGMLRFDALRAARLVRLFTDFMKAGGGDRADRHRLGPLGEAVGHLCHLIQQRNDFEAKEARRLGIPLGPGGWPAAERPFAFDARIWKYARTVVSEAGRYTSRKVRFRRP